MIIAKNASLIINFMIFSCAGFYFLVIYCALPERPKDLLGLPEAFT